MRKLLSSVILLLMIFFLCLVPLYAASPTDEAVLGNDRWSVTTSGDLIPNTTAAYDIGDATHYVDTAYITTSVLGGNTTVAGTILPTSTHARNIGSSTYEFSGIYADGATVDSLVAGTADINGGSVDGATVGVSSASTGSFTTLAYSGVLTPGSSSSYKVNYEVFTTGDTLTATDSGKYIVTNLADADGYVDFVLPAATTAGLEYKFVAGATSKIRIDPEGSTVASDHILYASLALGDRIASAAVGADGASGDSITLISTGTGWVVGSMNPDDGSWVDAD